MPRDRILPETDFPARQVRARVPGETMRLEARLAHIWRVARDEARYQLWTNLKQLANQSGAIDAASKPLADVLLSL